MHSQGVVALNVILSLSKLIFQKVSQQCICKDSLICVGSAFIFEKQIGRWSLLTWKKLTDEVKMFDMKLCSLMKMDFLDKMLLTYFLINKSDNATSQLHIDHKQLTSTGRCLQTNTALLYLNFALNFSQDG